MGGICVDGRVKPDSQGMTPAVEVVRGATSFCCEWKRRVGDSVIGSSQSNFGGKMNAELNGTSQRGRKRGLLKWQRRGLEVVFSDKMTVKTKLVIRLHAPHVATKKIGSFAAMSC